MNRPSLIQREFGCCIHLIALYIAVDEVAVVRIEAQGIKYLSQTEVRKVTGNLFGRRAKTINLDDSSYGRSSSLYHRFTPEYLLVCYNVLMFGNGQHNSIYHKNRAV